ncbi:zinc metallopeptidase [soil metagenome]
MIFDPLYLLIVAPGMLLAMWATWRVKSTFHHASQIMARSGVTGAQAAKQVLDAENVSGVGIETVPGQLSDHYDPSAKVLRLSEGVYGERSIAALGIAAHEAGHAIQDARRYTPLVIRNLAVPLASFGSNFAYIAFFIGLFAQITGLIYAGIALFSAVVFFQVINLPVEFDASRRARESLQMTGLLTAEEDREVARVLNAAAMTYVAGTLTSIMTLLYFLYRSGLLGGRSN